MKDPLVPFQRRDRGRLAPEIRPVPRDASLSQPERGRGPRFDCAALIEEVIADDASEAMGVVTLIYDHHVSRIGAPADRLAAPSP